MKYALDQFRLLVAEKLIYWALCISPSGHPDSVAILEAAIHVMKREPAKRS